MEPQTMASRSFETLLTRFFSTEDAAIIRLYFPTTPKLNPRYLYLILSDVLQVHKDKSKPVGTVVAIYSAVGVLSTLFNLILLQLMRRIRYKSSSALFLMLLMLLDTVSSLMILVELLLSCTKNLPTLDPHNPFVREFTENARIGLQLTSFYLLFLVAVDRWLVHVLAKARLFKENRLLKFSCSLIIPASVTFFIAYFRPSTLTMRKGGASFEIYPCVYLGCRGSILQNHPWRYPFDIRGLVDEVVAFGSVALVFLVFIPFYSCLWDILTSKAIKEQSYQVEREDIKTTGSELIYFDHMKRTLKRRSRLPIIFEVDETESNVEESVLFPYSLLILHGKTKDCDKAQSDSYWYDKKPKPENAPCLDEMAPVYKDFDTDIDSMTKMHHKRKRLKSKSHALSLRYVRRPLNKKIVVAKSTGKNWNTNRYQPSPCLVIKSQLHEDKSTQTDKDMSMVSPQHMCASCSKHKRGGNESNAHFFTRQIVFSVNCCCNKPSSIECVNEIQYPIRGSATKIHVGSGDSRAAKEDCSNCVGVMGIKSLRSKGCHPDSYEVQQPERSGGPAQFTFPASPSVSWDSFSNQTLIVGGYTSQPPRSQTKNVFEPRGASLQAEKFSMTNLQKNQWWTQQYPKNWELCTQWPKQWDLNRNNINDGEPSTQNGTIYESTANSIIVGEDLLSVQEGGGQDLSIEQGLQEVETMANNSVVGALEMGSIVSTGSTPRSQLAALNNKSLEIYLLVKEHFAEHSEPLDIIGLPATLRENLTSQKLMEAQHVIIRLGIMTITYILIRFLPWLVEVDWFEFSDVMSLTSYFSGLVQFVLLSLFSKTFRLHLHEYWKTLEGYMEPTKGVHEKASRLHAF